MTKKDFNKVVKKHLDYHYFADKYVKRPKYSNRSASCLSHHIHQSILEADYCNELFFLKRAGAISDFTIQHKIDLRVHGVHITNHYVDFRVLKPNGCYEFHEVKGYATDLWQIKKRLTEALFPQIPYVIKSDKKKNIYNFLSKMSQPNLGGNR